MGIDSIPGTSMRNHCYLLLHHPFHYDHCPCDGALLAHQKDRVMNSDPVITPEGPHRQQLETKTPNSPSQISVP